MKHRIIVVGLILLVLAVLFVWLNLPTPLRISEEMTYSTSPLMSDGKRIDYFRAWEERAYPPEMKTDENGYRMFLRSFGLPDEYSDSQKKQFYEKLGLDADVDAEPTHTIRAPYRYLGKDWEDHKPYDEALCRGYWTLDEFPQLADWLAENSDSIDKLGEALRKPVFRVPLVRESETSLLSETLTLNIRHYQQFRAFARAVACRAYYRMGIGDIDGAIEDTLTAYRLYPFQERRI